MQYGEIETMYCDILLMRAPHKAWKLITHWDNFLPPLGKLSIGAMLLQNGFNVKMIDCCINQWGWESLTKALKMIDPPVIGLGGPITWYDENMRLFKIAKSLNPNVINIYGGPFATLCPEKIIYPGSPVDFVIYGEGEYTTLELMNELKRAPQDRDFSKIRGLVYLKNEHPFYTPPRPLVKDLDELPSPAYELLPIERYGDKRGMWGRVISVYHSKGCIDNCIFCSCWKAGGEIKCYDASNKDVSQKWRTKSVKKTLEELKYIKDKWNKDLYLFTDDTWNVNPKWNEEFAEKYKKEYGLTADWFAFMRTDFIYRDIKNGIFKKLYEDSNLRHIIIGMERSTQKGLNALGKHNTVTKSDYVVRWIRQNCRDIFVQGTFINGLWEDNNEDILAQGPYAKALGVDYPAFHVVTPFPGTPLYDWYDSQNLIDKRVPYDSYEFDTAIVPTKYLTREEVAKYNKEVNQKYAADPLYLVRGLFLTGRARSKLYRHFMKRMIILLASSFLDFKKPPEYNPLKKIHTDLFNVVEPDWYNK